MDLSFQGPPNEFGLIAFGVAAMWALHIAVHVAFAVGVAAHAKGRRTVLVPSFWWVVGTLLGGVMVAVAYWAVHSSRLARPGAEQATSPRRPLRGR